MDGGAAVASWGGHSVLAAVAELLDQNKVLIAEINQVCVGSRRISLGMDLKLFRHRTTSSGRPIRCSAMWFLYARCVFRNWIMHARKRQASIALCLQLNANVSRVVGLYTELAGLCGASPQ
jgi:hypothetical protein